MIIVMEYTEPSPETYTPAASVPRRVEIRNDGSRYDARIRNNSTEIDPAEAELWRGAFTPEASKYKELIFDKEVDAIDPAVTHIRPQGTITAVRKELNDALCSGRGSFNAEGEMHAITSLARAYIVAESGRYGASKQQLEDTKEKLDNKIAALIDKIGEPEYQRLYKKINSYSLDHILARQFADQYEQDIHDLQVQNWMIY